MDTIFAPEPTKTVPVIGVSADYPIRRIFCVGRNYVAHAAEMGGEVDREAPWYFTKTPYSVTASGATVPYALGTQHLHYEMELVVALGADILEGTSSDAARTVYGYGCGLDMTRRDLQQIGKDNRLPWDFGKDFEHGAILAPLTPAATFGAVGEQPIQLQRNGELKQDATLADMVCSVPEVISHLSHFYHLGPGDIIMTGTPAGVGPVSSGDRLVGTIAGLEPVGLTIA
ncbi:MAG: fumarylacetoacetate hydrolase family protein [Pseudomonadota bacterium]